MFERGNALPILSTECRRILQCADSRHLLITEPPLAKRDARSPACSARSTGRATDADDRRKRI
jgi:hypothetical protein